MCKSVVNGEGDWKRVEEIFEKIKNRKKKQLIEIEISVNLFKSNQIKLSQRNQTDSQTSSIICRELFNTLLAV